VNDNLAKLADGQKIRFLNVNGKMTDGEGKLYPGIMNADNLHPAVKGYEIWAAGLRPMLTELLGAPAKESENR